MELSARLSDFESFKLHAEFREDCTLQCVRTSPSAPRKWQTWKRARKLGGGSSGNVWQERFMGEDGDWQYRALKVCPKEQMDHAGVDYKRELSALAAFSASKHSGLFVSLHGWWMEPKHVYVAMEYLSRGDLSAYVPAGINEEEAKEVADDLLNGLLAMHQEGFTHRDIKPQNILVVQKRPEFRRWRVKIGDFGISKRILENSGTSLHTSLGTRPYCAPEILGYLKQYEQTSKYSSKVDTWSLGCVLYNIGTRGQLAFSESNLVRYCDGQLPFNPTGHQLHFGADGVSLIKWLLQPDPETRLNAAEALDHPWISRLKEPVGPKESLPEVAQEARSPSPSKNTSSPPPRNYNSFLDSTISLQPNDGLSNFTSLEIPDRDNFLQATRHGGALIGGETALMASERARIAAEKKAERKAELVRKGRIAVERARTVASNNADKKAAPESARIAAKRNLASKPEAEWWSGGDDAVVSHTSSKASNWMLTYSDVAMHNTKKDLFIAIDDEVFDASSFVDEHPGGEEVLLDVAGQDATEAWKGVRHTDEAAEILAGLRIGSLQRQP